MTVESATYINDLDVLLPLSGNVYTEGDDQTRLLKKVIKNTFIGDGDGFLAPILATESDLNNIIGITSNIQAQLTEIINSQVPLGGIVEFNGVLTSVSTPFAVCDGTNGTPNLTNMFVYAANVEADLGATGGFENSFLVTHDHDIDHTHTGSTSTDGTHVHAFTHALSAVNGEVMNSSVASPPLVGQTLPNGDHDHTVEINNSTASTVASGSDGVGKNLPPFVYLGYIMRIS